MRESADGRVWGWNRFHVFDGSSGFELTNAARLDCLEVDPATGEARVSGVLTMSEPADHLPGGTAVVAYDRD